MEYYGDLVRLRSYGDLTGGRENLRRKEAVNGIYGFR